jgi:AcrR family transcriptional regulator
LHLEFLTVTGNPPVQNPELPDELAQLPHGRHGLPPEFVQRNQRERLIAAFTVLVGEAGYGAATITGTTEGAGVSSNAFYKYFETIEDCCIAAFDKAREDLRPLVAEAFEAEAEWPQGIRQALAVVLADFAEFPEIARLLTAEPFVAGPRIAAKHKQAIEGLVPYLKRGRELTGSGDLLPDTAEKGLLGAANSLVARQVLAGKGGQLEDLLADLTQFILTPYLGADEARRVAGAP